MIITVLLPTSGPRRLSMVLTRLLTDSVNSVRINIIWFIVLRVFSFLHSKSHLTVLSPLFAAFTCWALCYCDTIYPADCSIFLTYSILSCCSELLPYFSVLRHQFLAPVFPRGGCQAGSCVWSSEAGCPLERLWLGELERSAP